MKHSITIGLALVGVVFFTMGCVTLDPEDGPPEPPEITAQTPITEAVDAAILHGGETLEKVKRLFTKQKSWVSGTAKVHSRLEDYSSDY